MTNEYIECPRCKSLYFIKVDICEYCRTKLDKGEIVETIQECDTGTRKTVFA